MYAFDEALAEAVARTAVAVPVAVVAVPGAGAVPVSVPPSVPVPVDGGVAGVGGAEGAVGADGAGSAGVLVAGAVAEPSGVEGSAVAASPSPGACGSSEPGAVRRSNSWAGEERRAASV